MGSDRNLPQLVIGFGFEAERVPTLQEILRNFPRGQGVAVIAAAVRSPGSADSGDTNLDARQFTWQDPSWPIEPVKGPTPLKPGSVFICSLGSRQRLRLADGTLSIVDSAAPDGNEHDPMDHFFFTLAEEVGCDVIGILLGEPASRGHRGLRAIAQSGGLTIIEAAGSDDAADLAKSSDCNKVFFADYFLQRDEIADELIRYCAGGSGSTPRDPDLVNQIAAAVPQIAGAVQRFIGKEIKHYRTPTLVRRIQRRMHVMKIASVNTYLELVRRSRDECERLFRDLLIGVTGFFRDPAAFESLAERVIGPLVASGSEGDAIRVWIPGCASGEEAYSISMLFHEAFEVRGRVRPLQIFATDLDDDSLRAGRRGAFPARIRDELTPERFHKYFRRHGKGFEIAAELKSSVTFLKHDLIHDPPLTELDLISCRNLLIYFGSHLQAKLMPLFHDSLRPNGFLFLGPAETPEHHRELFRIVDQRSRILQRKSTAISVTEESLSGRRAMHREANSPMEADVDFHKIGQKIVLDEFGPQWAIIDDDEHIIALSADTTPFLKLSGGRFENNLTQMLHAGLKQNVRSALGEARESMRRVVRDRLSVAVPGGKQRIAVTVQPMPQFGENRPLYFIAFQKLGEPLPRGLAAGTGRRRDSAKSPAAEALIEQLEQELATTRNDLERNVNELERNNEELKASNSELLSINEELRATNEELQSAKHQNMIANRRLADNNSDLENLLRSSNIATIFLDAHRAIRGFTPAATDVFGLTPADIGRPLQELQPRYQPAYPVPADEELFQAGGPIEHSVETPDNRWFIRRVLPYYRKDNTTDGVVITFSEVTRLRDSEAHLRRIIDNMLGFVGVLTPSGELVEINQAALTAGGLKPSEVIGRKFWECFWWSHDPVVMSELEAAIARAATGKIVRYDTRIRVREDRRIWLDIMLVPVTNAAGEVTHIIQSGVDVDKRVSAQQLLEQSERLNRLMADNISQIAWIADEQGHVAWFNRRWFEFTGTTIDEVTGLGWLAVLHPDHVQRVSKSMETAIAAGAFWEDTFPLRGKDGNYRWFLARAVPAFDDEGRINRWFGTKTDITDRMRYEQELQRSQAKLKLSIAIAGLALAEVDYRYDRVQLSAEAAELFGLGNEACEVPRRTMVDLIHPDDREEVHAAYESALLPDTGGIIDLKYRIVRRNDGTVRWINVRKQVFFRRNEEGRESPHSGMWAILDISEQKQVEADLEFARHQAESANRAKSDFLANMSHEIRSPMAAILGYADLIETHDQDTHVKIETIRRNGQFLLALVNDILDLSKIEAGKMVVDSQRFSPISLVEDVCALMHVRAEEAGIDLRFEFDGSLPGAIDNDPVRLRQILINLVGNAIKFTEHGSVTLVARYLSKSKQMQFDVIDTGIGMSPEQVARLFLPFEQGDSSIRRVYGGSGLGLTISQRLAKLLGGEITAHSRLGEGSVFTLTIAAARPATERDATSDTSEMDLRELHDSAAQSAAEETPTDDEPLAVRTLIVDDRRDLRLLSQRFIEKFGGSVLIAEDGGQALEIIEREAAAQREIDVVLMDLQMPKMDGITTTKLLRERGFKNPIIALTANAMESNRQHCLESGFTDFLSKPIDSHELYRILRRYRPQ